MGKLMELNEYQDEAQKTNLIAGRRKKIRRDAAMLGLASETGSLLDIHKKVITAAVDPDVGRVAFRRELGDLLWYVAAVAKADGLSLEELAQMNLERTRKGYGGDLGLVGLPILDLDSPPKERFPRRLVIHFKQFKDDHGRLRAKMTLLEAIPDPFFPKGAKIQKTKSNIGFTVGAELGDSLTDNARRVNGYRFHDAIHLGFLAHLGWSPTLRSVLGLKRRSDDATDEGEDSARLIFAEEGLAAVLFRLSKQRMNFKHALNIDGEIIEVVQACTEGSEAEGLPGWAWRRAITSGFDVMEQLTNNRGGYVIADLDDRTLTYSRTKPRLVVTKALASN
jgi:hypothetical protein